MRLPPVAGSLCLLVALVPLRSSGVEDEKVKKPPAQLQPTRGFEMIYGPVLNCSVEVPGKSAPVPAKAPEEVKPATEAAATKPATGAKPPAAPKIPPTQVIAKGIAIKLGDEGAVCFDTDLMRMAVGWTGGFLDLKKTNIATYKGFDTGAGLVKGDVQFETLALPGWSTDETFTDPRQDKIGPLKVEYARFKGLYRHGDRAVLAYSVDNVDVLESPELKRIGDRSVFVRHFNIAPSKQPVSVLLDLPLQQGETLEGADSSSGATIRRGNLVTRLSLSNAPAGAVFRAGPGGIYLTIPDHAEPIAFAIALARDPASEKGADLAGIAPAMNLAEFCKGGPGRWPALPELAGAVSTESGAYVVDTIPIPDDNPWKSWMRVSAFDFLPDGRAAVATLNGDVWLVSGLDEKLEKVQWKRIANGLYEPLGLKVRSGEIFVHCKDQITRLRDLNGDSEIDFYECFNSDRVTVANYHTFAFDLQTDRIGNFYYVTGGNQLGTYRPWHAAVVKVLGDGSRSEVIATGFRAPNGLFIGPRDEIVVSDNQGQWVPSSKLNLIRPGGFYGHVADPRIQAKAPAPAGYDQPLCWIPMTMDNSSGGGVWARDNGKWGPLGGHMLHVSYGSASLFAVMPRGISADEATLPSDGNHNAPAMQGSVVKLPVKFASGLMRARFSPADGQLYVTGLKGWQTAGAKDGCFQRVRYTGAPANLPVGIDLSGDILRIHFAAPLDLEIPADPEAFSLEQWDYKWWETYGSPDLSPTNPTQKKRDVLDVTGAEVSADGRRLSLKVPDLRFAMQTLLKGTVRFADGTESTVEIAGTFYNAPKPGAAAAQ